MGVKQKVRNNTILCTPWKPFFQPEIYKMWEIFVENLPENHERRCRSKVDAVWWAGNFRFLRKLSVENFEEDETIFIRNEQLRIFDL